MNVLAIIQARVSSSRLPGKVLKPILGTPMILQMTKRLETCRLIDHMIIATSTHTSDDPLARLFTDINNNKISCFRGNLEDVLDRFYQAAFPYQPAHIVRLTGDCPVIDPTVVDYIIKIHLTEGNDYTTNALEPSFPDGLDVEIMTYSTLCTAWKQATLPSEREHVTFFIQKHPDLFQLRNVLCQNDLSHLRWTVDEQEDFELITLLYHELYDRNPLFAMQDILDLLERKPSLLKFNSHIKRNEGLEKSLAADSTAGQN